MRATTPGTIRALTLVAVITAGAVTAPVALADETEELKTKFAAADSNGDGKLTVEEAKAGGMRRIVRGFDRIDADGDGFITLEQIEAMMKSR
jgi:Ca2+-binding EF-hand superfamily protein